MPAQINIHSNTHTDAHSKHKAGLGLQMAIVFSLVFIEVKFDETVCDAYSRVKKTFTAFMTVNFTTRNVKSLLST